MTVRPHKSRSIRRGKQASWGDLRLRIRRSPSIRRIRKLLSDDDPLPRDVAMGARTPNLKRDGKLARIEDFLMTEAWRLRWSVRAEPEERIPFAPRRLRALASMVERVAEEARVLLPLSARPLMESLPRLAAAARKAAAERPARRPTSGRPRNPVSDTIAGLDRLLREIPAAPRRALVRDLLRETLEVDTAEPEAMRAMLRERRRRQATGVLKVVAQARRTAERSSRK